MDGDNSLEKIIFVHLGLRFGLRIYPWAIYWSEYVFPKTAKKLLIWKDGCKKIHGWLVKNWNKTNKKFYIICKSQNVCKRESERLQKKSVQLSTSPTKILVSKLLISFFNLMSGHGGAQSSSSVKKLQFLPELSNWLTSD